MKTKRSISQPDGNVKNQIDHVLINGRWKHSLHNVTVKRGAGVGSDHHLLLATVKLQLEKSLQDRREGAKVQHC